MGSDDEDSNDDEPNEESLKSLWKSLSLPVKEGSVHYKWHAAIYIYKKTEYLYIGMRQSDFYLMIMVQCKDLILTVFNLLLVLGTTLESYANNEKDIDTFCIHNIIAGPVKVTLPHGNNWNVLYNEIKSKFDLVVKIYPAEMARQLFNE